MPISQIVTNSIANGAVVADDLANNSITSSKIASGQTLALNGIQFPATQVLSADANTLDDYEEGTWTPILGGAGGNGTLTYALQQGGYTKIGNMVTCWGRVQASSTVSGGSGTLQIFGLPFTAANTVGWFGHSTIGYFNNLSAYGSGGSLTILGPEAGTTYLRFHAFSNTGVSGLPTQANLLNGTEFYFGCSYRV
jgi:hypothetical protein